MKLLCKIFKFYLGKSFLVYKSDVSYSEIINSKVYIEASPTPKRLKMLRNQYLNIVNRLKNLFVKQMKRVSASFETKQK
jgi:hypothetical protein